MIFLTTTGDLESRSKSPKNQCFTSICNPVNVNLRQTTYNWHHNRRIPGRPATTEPTATYAHTHDSVRTYLRQPTIVEANLGPHRTSYNHICDNWRQCVISSPSFLIKMGCGLWIANILHYVTIKHHISLHAGVSIFVKILGGFCCPAFDSIYDHLISHIQYISVV